MQNAALRVVFGLPTNAVAAGLALGLGLGLFGCGSSAGSGGGTGPVKPLLGSYEVALSARGTGAQLGAVRLDLVKNEKSEIIAWTQDGGVLRRNALTIEERALRLSFQDAAESMTLVVTLDDRGRPTTATGERSRAGGPAEPLDGVVRNDGTAPQIRANPGPALPWEEGEIRFSETVFEKDLTPPKVDGLSFSLLTVPESPWVAGLRVKTSAWDAIPDPIPGIVVADPSQNRATLSAGGTFAKIGPAAPSYDFGKDEPAWKSPTVKRTQAECEKDACLLVQSGERVALRLPQGKKVVNVRLRVYSGRDGAPPVRVPLVVSTAARGSAATELAGIELAFAKLDGATNPEKSYATAFVDLPVPLPAGPECGVTLGLAASAGAPYFLALQRADTE